MQIPQGKKIYFSSDNHLGAPTREESLPREIKFVKWLDTIKDDAAAIFLLGDLFDFWFEYKTVVPKGFVRTLGKLAEIRESGIPIYFFVGNHDLWMNGYFEKELNIPIFHKPQEFILNNKTFVISGVFEDHSREELKSLIDQNGGKNLTSISSKTNFLLAGDKVGPSKLKKAKDLDIMIIDEKYFIEMLNN